MQIETGWHIILNQGLFQPVFVGKAPLAPFTHNAKPKSNSWHYIPTCEPCHYGCCRKPWFIALTEQPWPSCCEIFKYSYATIFHFEPLRGVLPSNSLQPRNSPNSSKCVSMPFIPGTEHASLALRKVVHLFTSILCPPMSFWEEDTRNSFLRARLDSAKLHSHNTTQPIHLPA